MKVVWIIVLVVICLVIGGFVGSRIGYQRASSEHIERVQLWLKVDSLHLQMVMQSAKSMDTLLTLLGDDFALSARGLDDFRKYAIKLQAEVDSLGKVESHLLKQLEKYE